MGELQSKSSWLFEPVDHGVDDCGNALFGVLG